ncbi:MAG: hypothetical protein GX589_00935 [Deltaproteobacteria bacterium]|nr:hypothetical protein [Deltaproteobacteria bacterium]
MPLPPVQTSPRRSSPLDEIYRNLVQREQTSRAPYALPSFTAPEEPPSTPTATTESPTAGPLDAFLGIGHYLSRLSESSLPRLIAPQVQSIGAGLTRAATGIVTALGAFYRCYKAGSNDIKNGDYSFPTARRESVVSLGSIGAGIAVGEVGFYATAAAVSLGTPVAFTTALGIGTAIAAGLVASYTRNWLGDYYDSIKGPR